MAITVRRDKQGNPRAFQATVRMRGERSTSATFLTYAAAEEFERNTMAAIRASKRKTAGTAPKPAKTAALVGERISAILDLYLAAHPTDRRMRTYKEAIKRRVEDARVCDLGIKWTRGFVDRMRAEKAGRRGRTSKDSTINAYLRMISKLCKWRADELEVACPQLGLTRKFFARDWNDGRERRLTGDEEHRIRAALSRIGAKPYRLNAPGQYGRPLPQARHYALAFDFALETGARESEIVNLPWPELDLAVREWRLPAARSKTKRRRTIYLSIRALDILNELLSERSASSDRVFHLLPKPDSFSATFGDAVAKAGVEDYVFHDTRHECISRLLNSGAVLPGAMLRMAGHSSLHMTMRYFNPQRDEILDRMDAVHARAESRAIERHIAPGAVPSSSTQQTPRL